MKNNLIAKSPIKLYEWNIFNKVGLFKKKNVWTIIVRDKILKSKQFYVW